MAGRPSGADDPNGPRSDLRVNDVQKTLLPRVPNQNETFVVQRIRIVGALRILERGGRLRECDSMLSRVAGRFSRIPREPHAI
jgi:hypothetical protein